MRKPQQGVYLALCCETQMYKIGYTLDIKKRMYKLPGKHILTALIATPYLAVIERELHARFASKRIGNTEYFDLTEQDVTYICGLPQNILHLPD